MKRLKLVILFLVTSSAIADPFQNQTYQNQTKIRQLEIDQRMKQIQQEMKTESSAMLNSTGSSGRVFSPSLPGYTSPPRISTNHAVSQSQVEAYLEGLGDPEKSSGIYAYPPEERLYQYGLMCIEVGFVNEGVRAITEHLRISAEQN